MQKKIPNPRKQKRLFKKMLFLSLISGGIVVAAGVGLYLVILYKLSQPLYVTPLASANFLHAAQSDEVVLIKKELSKQQIAYASVEKGPESSYIVKLDKGGEVTFSSQKDIITQIASLQYILTQLTMEGRLFSRLDLRFDKPVIVLRK